MSKIVRTKNRVAYFNDAGQIHREDGPAIEWFNGDKEYYINGKRHRIDGPAIEKINGYKEQTPPLTEIGW